MTLNLDDMIRILIIITFIPYWTCSVGYSQEWVKELQVGDTIPNELWSYPLRVINHPHGLDTVSLSDYRQKELMILDFWSEGCTPCYMGFYRVDGLPERYTGLQFLLVNARNPYRPDRTSATRIRDVLTALISSMKFPNGLKTPSVVEDTVLTKLFPHRFVPHYVWIGGDGIVKKITQTNEVDEYNIRTFLYFDRRRRMMESGMSIEEIRKIHRF